MVFVSTPSRSATSFVVSSFSAMCFTVPYGDDKLPNDGQIHPVNQKARKVSSRQNSRTLAMRLSPRSDDASRPREVGSKDHESELPHARRHPALGAGTRA